MRRFLVVLAMAGALASACASPSSSSKSDGTTTFGISANGAAVEVKQPAPKQGESLITVQPQKPGSAPSQKTGIPPALESPAPNFLNPDASTPGRKCAGTPESAPTCTSR